MLLAGLIFLFVVVILLVFFSESKAFLKSNFEVLTFWHVNVIGTPRILKSKLRGLAIIKWHERRMDENDTI